MGKTVPVRTWASDHNRYGSGHPSRRSVLLAFGASVGAVTLSGCGLLDSKPKPPPAPDALTAFLAETNALLTQYETAISRFPAIAATLIPIRDAHRAHAAALVAIMTPPPVVPSGVASGAPSSGASTAPTGDQKTEVSKLRTAEQAAQKKAVETCATAPAARATLLGEIAAARAGHLEVLA
jgi:hypothetical protein